MVSMAVKMYKEERARAGGRAGADLGGGETPPFAQFVMECSPVPVWNLVLPFKVDVDWFNMWAGEFSGR